MPPRSQLPLELLQALDHEHNSREVSFGEGCVRCLHTGKVLGCWAKVQLVVKLQGCKPNQQHMKKLELQGLTAAYKKQKAACLWCPMCTEAGKLEEKTVTRKEKELYRKARDAEWGDRF